MIETQSIEETKINFLTNPTLLCFLCKRTHLFFFTCLNCTNILCPECYLINTTNNEGCLICKTKKIYGKDHTDLMQFISKEGMDILFKNNKDLQSLLLDNDTISTILLKISHEILNLETQINSYKEAQGDNIKINQINQASDFKFTNKAKITQNEYNSNCRVKKSQENEKMNVSISCMSISRSKDSIGINSKEKSIEINENITNNEESKNVEKNAIIKEILDNNIKHYKICTEKIKKNIEENIKLPKNPIHIQYLKNLKKEKNYINQDLNKSQTLLFRRNELGKIVIDKYNDSEKKLTFNTQSVEENSNQFQEFDNYNTLNKEGRKKFEIKKGELPSNQKKQGFDMYEIDKPIRVKKILNQSKVAFNRKNRLLYVKEKYNKHQLICILRGVVNLNECDFDFKYSKENKDRNLLVNIRFTNQAIRALFRQNISLIFNNRRHGIVNFYTPYSRIIVQFKLIDFETYLTFYNKYTQAILENNKVELLMISEEFKELNEFRTLN